MLEFMAITNDVRCGAAWHRAGVDRIMIDLERLGKRDRQRGRDTVMSDHRISDIAEMRQAVPGGHIVVRCEPTSLPGWPEHIEQVLGQGPNTVRLPMVESKGTTRSPLLPPSSTMAVQLSRRTPACIKVALWHWTQFSWVAPK